MPAPGKALLQALGRTEDIGQTVVEGDPVAKVAPVTDGHGNTNNVAALTKGIHAEQPHQDIRPVVVHHHRLAGIRLRSLGEEALP